MQRTDAGRIIGGTNRAVGTYYAQLWALMLFLREGADGRYAADFQRLLKTLGEGNLESYARAAHIWSQHAAPNFGEDLFRSFISEDLDAVQREYQAFMRQRFFGKS